MDNNNSLRTLLVNIRNNQELYMQHQWKVAYFSFLLYAATIGVSTLIDIEIYFFIFSLFIVLIISLLIICKLDKSIEKSQAMAEKIYDLLPPLREVVGEKEQPKTWTIGMMLSAIVAIGMVLSFIALCSK